MTDDDLDTAPSTATTDTSDGEARTSDEDRSPPRPHRRRPGVPLIVAIVVAVLALALAGVLGFFLLQERAGDDESEAVEESVGRFALALTTWDASDGMGDTREELRAASTERFAAEVDELFGGTGDLAELEEIEARSTSEVEDILIQSLDGQTAEALAVVVQRVTTEITEGEEVSLRYARLGLEREEGSWQVDRVELLVDLLQEQAERVEGAELPGGLDLEDDLPPPPDDAEGTG